MYNRDGGYGEILTISLLKPKTIPPTAVKTNRLSNEVNCYISMK